jgi:hypothetical protein
MLHAARCTTFFFNLFGAEYASCRLRLAWGVLTSRRRWKYRGCARGLHNRFPLCGTLGGRGVRVLCIVHVHDLVFSLLGGWDLI